jgi:hypothetical protein
MKEKLRFLSLDVHAETIAVAIAEPDRLVGEVKITSEKPTSGHLSIQPNQKASCLQTAGQARRLTERGEISARRDPKISGILRFPFAEVDGNGKYEAQPMS